MGSFWMETILLCENWRVEKCLILNCTKYIHWEVRRELRGGEAGGGFGGLFFQDWHSLPPRERMLHTSLVALMDTDKTCGLSCSLDKSALDISVSRKEDRNLWIIFEEAEVKTKHYCTSSLIQVTIEDSLCPGHMQVEGWDGCSTNTLCQSNGCLLGLLCKESYC